MLVLTDQENRVIKDAPKNWFKPDDLPYYYRARNGICERLEKKGIFEKRICPYAKKSVDDGLGIPSQLFDYRIKI